MRAAYAVRPQLLKIIEAELSDKNIFSILGQFLSWERDDASNPLTLFSNKRKQ
jgi:hypothetical protein